MTRETIDIALPKKMELHRKGSHIEIVLTWFGWITVFQSVLTVWLGAFLFKWYNILSANATGIVLFFTLFFVCIYMTYYAIASWFNRTYIKIGQGKITVRHRPFPYFGNKTMNTLELKQLYAKKGISSQDHRTTYHVRAITNAGKDVKLVGYLETKEQALFIEQEIEQYIGIQDKHVEGALGT